MTDHLLVFVGGLHRSGTTLLARAIARHDEASGFTRTPVNANEGQHLQSVYPIVAEFGGAGQFGFDERSHLTEDSPLVTEANRERLMAEWGEYWNLRKRVLIEKSPGNLLKLRFLQALFEDAAFVVVMRHPIAVSYATEKWSESPLDTLLEHWLVCHELFLDDAARIRRLLLVRYEEFVAGPRSLVDGIQRYLGLEPATRPLTAKGGINDTYFERWGESLRSPGGGGPPLVGRFEERVNRFGYSLEHPDRAVEPAPEVAALLARVRRPPGALTSN